MSNGEEMEITTPSHWAGVSRQEAMGKVCELFSNWVVLWASMP